MSAPQTWPEWPKHMAPDEETAVLAEFDALLASWGVVNFTARELFRVNDHKPGEGKFQIAPREMWPRIAETVKMAQKIRNRWAAPVTCNCGYRTLAYNLRVDGRPHSKHMTFRAMDLSPGKIPPGKTWEDFVTTVRQVVEEHELHVRPCGFGQYPRKNFCHIDTGDRDVKARWIED